MNQTQEEDALGASGRPASWRDAWVRFSQHPTFLTLVSFALTGLIGGWITLQWQSREWDRQQRQLIRYHRIEQRYAIIDDLIKAAGTRNGGIYETANRLEYTSVSNLTDADLANLKSDLDKSTREWVHAKEMLRHRLYVYFSDAPAIIEAFEKLASRPKIYGSIEAVLRHGKNDPASTGKWSKSARKMAQEDAEATKSLVVLMTQKTESLYAENYSESQ